MNFTRMVNNVSGSASLNNSQFMQNNRKSNYQEWSQVNQALRMAPSFNNASKKGGLSNRTEYDAVPESVECRIAQSQYIIAAE